MSALEFDSEAELTAEINDLSSYLRGVPAELRESGAFTPYEVRLQQLLENLLALRLSQILQRYELALEREADRTALAQHRATYELLQQWVREAERRHEHAAQGYLRTAAVLNGLVVAFGAAAGAGALAATSAIAVPFAGLTALVGAFQLLFRPAEKSRAQQELAGRLEMLRMELESIATQRSSATSHEMAAHRVERALQLLSDSIVN